MTNFKMKTLTVRDARVVAKYLNQTNLKKAIFEVLFPKDNPNLPQNWMEFRQHLQSFHKMTDEEFKEYKKQYNDNLHRAMMPYLADFPNPNASIGETIVELVIGLFDDDKNYDLTIELLAHLFETSSTTIDGLALKDLIEMIKSIFTDSGFLELLQPSIPQTQMAGTTQSL